MTYSCTEEQALKALAGHEMHIIRDDGIHRHIRFRHPNTSNQWFDLITWPGTLCIDGDMGTYVFRRIEDMFEFFRTDREYALRRGNKLAINPSYWAEKLQADSVFGKGHKEFSSERFREYVKEAFDSWCESQEPITEGTEELWEEIEDQVLCNQDNGEIRAIDSALAFNSDIVPDFNFDDAWEWRCQEYTYHFIWCCYAIVWGIQLYDETKAAEQKEQAA